MKGQVLFYWGLVFFILSFFWTGYSVYDVNHAIQIPLVYWLNNPSLYPHDPFVATFGGYASLLWSGVAWSIRFISLEKLFFILFLIERALLIFAAAYLALSFIPKSRLAPIAAMAFVAFTVRSIIGSGTVVAPYFEQTGFAMVFFLLAAATFYRKQRFHCVFWTALGFSLNSMYGTYMLTYLAASFLVLYEYRAEWRKWIGPLALLFVLIAPAVAFAWKTLAKPMQDFNSQEWITAIQLFFPYHFYPETWSKRHWMALFIVVMLAMVVLRETRRNYSKLWSLNKVWIGVCVFWVLYAFYSAYVAASPAMMVMHPARATDIWYALGGISLLAAVSGKIEEVNTPLWTTIFYASFWVWQFYWGPHILTLLAFAVFLGASIIWKSIFLNGEPRRVVALLLIWGVVASAGSFYTRISESGSVQRALYHTPSAGAREVAQWADKNTDTKATFFVDPTWDFFRGLSKRSVFFLWRDGSAVLWDKSFAAEWMKRLNDFGIKREREKPIRNPDGTRKEIRLIFKKYTDAEVSTLARKYSLQYWVVRRNKVSSFPEVFRGRKYKVLSLADLKKEGV